MELLEYLNRAKDRAGLTSERRLAAALAITPESLRQYRRGIATPAPERMVQLAQLAGVQPEVALMDRFSWLADGPKSRAVVAQIMAMVQGSAAALLFAFLAFSSPAPAGTIGQDLQGTRYIMEREDGCG